MKEDYKKYELWSLLYLERYQIDDIIIISYKSASRLYKAVSTWGCWTYLASLQDISAYLFFWSPYATTIILWSWVVDHQPNRLLTGPCLCAVLRVPVAEGFEPTKTFFERRRVHRKCYAEPVFHPHCYPCTEPQSGKSFTCSNTDNKHKTYTDKN